ncbi:MAG: GNAT family N-acetyltransferase [Acetatifactor sp.]
MEEILKYIETHLKEDISLVELAELVHYSPRQIYNMVKETTGLPVMSYIRKRRLTYAALEISEGRKLYDVAMDYGFDTQAGFYKAFFQQIGCSPKEYQYHEQIYRFRRNLPKIEKYIAEESIMDNILIRKVEQSDAKSIWENVFSRNTPEEVEERIATSCKEMQEGRRVHLVAVIDENVIGNIILMKEQFVLYSHRCTIADLVVNPVFQKQGLATRLFVEACKYALEQGFSCVMTTCRADGTEEFYQSLGMRECGRIPNGIYEPWGEYKKFDEVIFVRELQ